MQGHSNQSLGGQAGLGASVGGGVFRLILGVFFLSGAAGLVYEVVWTRYLTLAFGVTAEAVSAVLSAYMAGLALGSLLARRWIPLLSSAPPRVASSASPVWPRRSTRGSCPT